MSWSKGLIKGPCIQLENTIGGANLADMYECVCVCLLKNLGFQFCLGMSELTMRGLSSDVQCVGNKDLEFKRDNWFTLIEK